MDPIDPGVLAVLEEGLHSDPALDFAVAALRSVVAAGGAGSDEDPAAGADLLVRLLTGTAPAEEIGRDLVRHPRALAGIFQNVDLLFLRGDPRAERVSAAVMRALEIASAKGHRTRTDES